MSDMPLPSSSPVPLLGCIADDVTGATDLAINLVQGGMRTIQWLSTPTATDLDWSGAQAVVISLKTRSVPVNQATQASCAALRALQAVGCQRFFFKYCSTFDSTPHGNIGPVAEALMEQLSLRQTVYCPAFPRNGRTLYQGYLFVGDRLLHESGMQHHPLNPMTDANIVRWLEQQTTQPVGLIPCADLDQGSERVVARMQDLHGAGIAHVVTDACHDRHLQTLSEAFATLPLVTGGSGIARYLPTAYHHAGLAEANVFQPRAPQVTGRSLILSGSCSQATQRQVGFMRPKCHARAVNVEQLMSDAEAALESIAAWAEASDAAQPIMIYSTDDACQVKQAQARFGRDCLASAIETFHGSIARRMVERLGVRRIIVAGGETAGAVIAALGVRALHIGPEICPGVPWTESHHPVHLALALKSGNFGSDEFFQQALGLLP